MIQPQMSGHEKQILREPADQNAMGFSVGKKGYIGAGTDGL
jgi:hypothetical protein